MSKQVSKAPIPIHHYWYLFGEEKTPRRIKEREQPEHPFKRFETQAEAIGHYMTQVENYCTGSKNIKENGCPKRFSCQLYSNFHKLAATGHFKNIYMGDIFKWAPYGEDKEKQFVCESFKPKEQ
jgi:hypothetical protein